jgi:formylglycine-generating enzyme required for sulfatase activity
MVWIPAGEFRMGASAADDQANPDEHPAVEVRVDAFWIDRREVTNDDYRRCVDDAGCTPPHDLMMFDDPNLGSYPVLWVDWYQAREYAAWAGKRLPTEAEWERAARAGGLARFPWGIVWDGRYANSLGTEAPDRWGGTAPVASFEPDAWGAYDLIGNAAEWVADHYHPDLWGAPRDGRAWNQLTGGLVEPRRVIRGGSYDDPPGRLRVSHRERRDPATWHRTVGFRCVAEVES